MSSTVKFKYMTERNSVRAGLVSEVELTYCQIAFRDLVPRNLPQKKAFLDAFSATPEITIYGA
jgi:hypothetical protein